MFNVCDGDLKSVVATTNNTTEKTMKLTKTANTKIKPGMTLIEITVVILVLLTLIAVLFIGANVYKKGADRAACILNLRNIQQAVRADQNLKGRSPGDDNNDGTALGNAVAFSTYMVGSGSYFETAPECPSNGSAYALTATAYPTIGSLAAPCPNVATLTDHTPDADDLVNW